MTYRVLVKPAAERDLEKLPRDVLRRVTERMIALEEDPRPPGCKKLTGEEDLYRIRVGDYRVVYEIDDGERGVRIARVRHRREVYRG
ncbi:MAG: type II toxin-antitoxin system RelE/ParE family toxin [Planctomycetes bacterium]|nr:type II toxin-antitoxin system RelE/ParE family toxin [Planctomycetota bacterium]